MSNNANENNANKAAREAKEQKIKLTDLLKRLNIKKRDLSKITKQKREELFETLDYEEQDVLSKELIRIDRAKRLKSKKKRRDRLTNKKDNSDDVKKAKADLRQAIRDKAIQKLQYKEDDTEEERKRKAKKRKQLKKAIKVIDKRRSKRKKASNKTTNQAGGVENEDINAFKETDVVTKKVETTFRALSAATGKKKRVAQNAYNNALKTYIEKYGEVEALKIVKKLHSQKIKPSTKTATPKTSTRTKTMHINEFSASSSNGKGLKSQSSKKKSSKKKSSEPKQQKKSWENKRNYETEEDRNKRVNYEKNNKISKSGIIHDISLVNDWENEIYERGAEYRNSLKNVFLYLHDLQIFDLNMIPQSYKVDTDISIEACADLGAYRIVYDKTNMFDMYNIRLNELFTFCEKAAVRGSLKGTNNIRESFKPIHIIYTTVPEKSRPFKWQLRYRYEKAIPLSLLAHFIENIHTKLKTYDSEKQIIYTNKLLCLILDTLAPRVGETHSTNQRKITEELSTIEDKHGRYAINILGYPLSQDDKDYITFKSILVFDYQKNDTTFELYHKLNIRNFEIY